MTNLLELPDRLDIDTLTCRAIIETRKGRRAHPQLRCIGGTWAAPPAGALP